MTVEEYVELRKQELDEFAEHWNKMCKELPGQYPKEIEGDAEWFEQEFAYNESRPGRERPW